MSNTAQRSFAKGEISPALYARTDQVAYATGLKTCRNFRVLRQGGIENRPGTVLVGETPSSGVVRLLPFVFNTAQTYVLEFSHLKLRFIRAGGYVGAPYVVTTPYTAADLADLQIAQSADVVTIVHPSHPPMNLARLADTNWTLTPVIFAPAIATPQNVALVPGTPNGTFVQYVVTAIDAKTGQESLASTPVGYSAIVKPQSWSLRWDAVAGASAYNVYKGGSPNGTDATDFGFIGSTGTPTFADPNLTPDMLNRAPVARNPFASADNYPSAIGYYQGRRVFAATNNNPETIWTSRSADYNNFTVSEPSQDDDALTLSLVGKFVCAVKHLVDHIALYAFSTQGESVISGDSSGVLRPTDMTALNYSKHGASALPPIELDARVLYVQARQSIVRDVAKDPFYGYKGNDLTVMSTHLFDGFTLVDWAYQEVPHSIIWIVRSDGVLLGLTDVAEQQVSAWHWHDTLGRFENVCIVPEGTEDAVYVCVNRNGARYIERFASRYFADVQDAIFLDAALSYDGRNTNGALTLAISGGSTWDFDELLTLTANTSRFSAGNVGDAFYVNGVDDKGAAVTVRFMVTAYTSGTVVHGFAQRLVPTPMRNVATSSWARAVATVSGLAHLEGRAVGVFADGYVVASPNNPAIAPVVVTGGAATLDRPYAYIHVGLPFVSDLETLDIDTPQGPSLKESKMLINRLSMIVENSRGIFAGPDAPDDDGTDGLVEWKLRDTEPYNVPVNLRTGTIKENIPAHWNTSGHVFARQVDPIPCTILGVIPTGNIPG